MALLAIVEEAIEVNVLVAAAAIAECYSCKALKISTVSRFFLVAIDAFHRLVFAQQGKIRLVVVEFFSRSKFFRVVALRTIIGGKG